MKIVKNGSSFRILKDGAEFFDKLPDGDNKTIDGFKVEEFTFKLLETDLYKEDIL